jgi:hypothetical protein
MVAAKRFPFTLALCVLLCSCSSRDPNWEETYPVTGEVYVDGQPAAGLQVTCHATEGLGTETGWVCKGMTDEEGKFEVNTYEKGDGVPEGDYVVTFLWGETNFASMNYGGPDKLKKKYLDPRKSEHKFTAVKGEPVELGRVELKTK